MAMDAADDDDDDDFGDAKVEVVMNVMVAKKAVKAAKASVTAAKKSAKRPGGIKRLIGHLHIPWVHLPIGWLILLFLIDVGAFVFQREGWEKWGLYALAGTVLVLVPAVTTGLVLASEILPLKAAFPQDQNAILQHRNLAFATTGLCAAALALRLWRRNRLDTTLKWLYLALLAAATTLVAWTGHAGGAVARGKDWLPF